MKINIPDDDKQSLFFLNLKNYNFRCKVTHKIGNKP